jgi:16S rRNA (cytidine1402-2'-O)-methyltransferase
VTPGTLFVVATPIGNLEDITLRALRVLREVDLVAAEDTRRTGNLLRYYEIATPLLSVHEHNEVARAEEVVARLRAGKSVALVSDAGTPGIADPGAMLVRAVRAAGLPVTPIPGASALTAAISASGLATGRFVFAGFPPFRLNARIEWLKSTALHSQEIIVFYESPHRIQQTLRDAATILGERPIIVARELTKMHEEWAEGPAASLAEHFSAPQGEFVVLVPPFDLEATPPPISSDEDVYELFGHLTNKGALGRRRAVKEIAARLSMSANAVYDAIERAKLLVK